MYRSPTDDTLIVTQLKDKFNTERRPAIKDLNYAHNRKIRQEVLPDGIIKVEYECPTCSKGILEFTGLMLMSMPAKYQHKCTVCNDVFCSAQLYPALYEDL